MNKPTYYSILDLVAAQFGPLFPAVNDGVAKRVFRGLLLNEKIDPDYFKDYELWQVGEFDEVDGTFEPVSEFVVAGDELMEEKN